VGAGDSHLPVASAVRFSSDVQGHCPAAWKIPLQVPFLSSVQERGESGLWVCCGKRVGGVR